MLPVKVVRQELAVLLASDPTYIGPVAANKMALVMAPFVPSENLVVENLTLADFTGSTPLAGVAGTQPTGTDPTTQEDVVTIKAPAGGWYWHTTALTNLPQTIYGFALLDATLATLIGTQLLSPPVTLQAIGDFIDLGKVDLTFVLQPLS